MSEETQNTSDPEAEGTGSTPELPAEPFADSEATSAQPPSQDTIRIPDGDAPDDDGDAPLAGEIDPEATVRLEQAVARGGGRAPSGEAPVAGDDDDLAYLVFLHPRDAYLGLRFELTHEETVIGRGEEANLVLDIDSASRTHAKIVRGQDGWLVLDLGSTNGTYVNNSQVDMEPLADGDVINIGNAAFKFLTGSDTLKYFEEIHRITICDSLTGAHNRRSMHEFLAAELFRCNKASRPISLVLVGVDGIDFVNESYGTLTGDYILRETFARMRDLVGPDGMLARYRGDIFAAILPETNPAQAYDFAERVRKRVTETPFTFEGDEVAVTVSAGVFCKRDDNVELEELITGAEANLYLAKQFGRDRVIEIPRSDRNRPAAQPSPLLEEAELRKRLDSGGAWHAVTLCAVDPTPLAEDEEPDRARLAHLSETLDAAIALSVSETEAAGRIKGKHVALIATRSGSAETVRALSRRVERCFDDLARGGASAGCRLAVGERVEASGAVELMKKARPSAEARAKRLAALELLPSSIAEAAGLLEEAGDGEEAVVELDLLFASVARWLHAMLVAAIHRTEGELRSQRNMLRTLYAPGAKLEQWVDALRYTFKAIESLRNNLLLQLGFKGDDVTEIVKLFRDFQAARAQLSEAQDNAAIPPFVTEWRPRADTLLSNLAIFREFSPLVVADLDFDEEREEAVHYRYDLLWLTGTRTARRRSTLRSKMTMRKNRVYAWSEKLHEALLLEPFIIYAETPRTPGRQIFFLEEVIQNDIAFRNLRSRERFGRERSSLRDISTEIYAAFAPPRRGSVPLPIHS